MAAKLTGNSVLGYRLNSWLGEDETGAWYKGTKKTEDGSVVRIVRHSKLAGLSERESAIAGMKSMSESFGADYVEHELVESKDGATANLYVVMEPSVSMEEFAKRFEPPKSIVTEPVAEKKGRVKKSKEKKKEEEKVEAAPQPKSLIQPRAVSKPKPVVEFEPVVEPEKMAEKKIATHQFTPPGMIASPEKGKKSERTRNSGGIGRWLPIGIPAAALTLFLVLLLTGVFSKESGDFDAGQEIAETNTVIPQEELEETPDDESGEVQIGETDAESSTEEVQEQPVAAGEVGTLSDRTGGSNAAQASLLPEEPAVHSYQVVLEDCTWQEAFERCIAMGGYLVRIDSEEEWNTVLALISNDSYQNGHFYLGGRREMDGRQYNWVDTDNLLTGEPLNGNPNSWAFPHWLAGEPSYADGNTPEMYLNLIFYQGSWVLNDVPENISDYYSGKTGYICETQE